jgi:hypothetical protein
MRLPLSLASCAAAIAAPLAAQAANISCPAPPGVVVASLDNGKAPAALLRAIGPMARPGGAFNATDVIIDRNTPGRRFILLWGLGPKWVVAYEQGGIAYMNVAAAYQVNGASVTKLGEFDEEPPTICARVHKLIGR